MSQSHSPLGFSGAERWSNCLGSVALIASLPPDVEEGDPEYRRAGVAAHEAAAHCLCNGWDAWEVPGTESYQMTAEDLRAVQIYLDVARARMPAVAEEGKASLITLIEEHLAAPEIHEFAYGTVDLALIAGTYAEVTDYKHGEGIFVDVVGNWQLMGYATLLLSRFPFIETFLLRIVQPRIAGADPVREWEIGTEDLVRWRDTELIPAMNRVQLPGNKRSLPILKPGPWCRFCKAKDALACPALEHNALVVQEAAPAVERISDVRLGELYGRLEPLKIMAKAIENEVLRRRLAGVDVPGSKTVQKRSWRVWKDTAKEALLAAIGPAVLTTPELKGPAEVEKLGKLPAQLVQEFAYSPDNGYTVAPLGDRRAAVTVQTASEKFGKVLDTAKEIG